MARLLTIAFALLLINMSCLALPNKTEIPREALEEPHEFRKGINPMHWRLQKLFESSDKIPQHFTTVDRRAVQLKLPVYRYDAGQSIWALAVPVQEFCKASAEIKYLSKIICIFFDKV